MIAYRYCSDKELDSLNRKNKIKGFNYETDEKINTHIYEAKQKYLHFYLDKDNVYNFDPIEPENFVEFRFPNEFDEFRGLGSYYIMNDDYNLELRYANQLAIPASLIKNEYVKNIEAINTSVEYEAKVRRLINNV